jgi:hypothetical protein
MWQSFILFSIAFFLITVKNDEIKDLLFDYTFIFRNQIKNNINTNTKNKIN